MKNSNKVKNSLSEVDKNSLIDEFYNETYEKVDNSVKYSDDYKEFKSNLISTSEKMDVLNEDIFDFDIDTLNIIKKAETLQENIKASKEFFLFIISSFIFLSLYVFAIIKIDSRILIISQIVIAIIAPWIIIPISIIRKRGSEV